ncbi:MAG TPA: M14 family metallopeptidase [Gemmatimonadales bacterium]
MTDVTNLTDLTDRLSAQQTRAERTNYAETSSHDDVLTFLDSLARAGAGIRRGQLATSPQGREVPYIVAARPMVDGPGEAHRSGKPVIYLQGNIHAGEIEGKEAALMLLRDLTLGSLRPLLDSVVLLLVPIYNSDGNDAFGPGERNRPGQNGPAIVGLRPNGQGLDLNRDYLKQEAPETRGAARLISIWDPDLFIDLHTTNGSYHGYALTYSPGLNPNSPPANEYVRDRFLPEVRRRMRERHRQEVYWYGNFRNQHPDSLTQGWETYDPRPRFGTNWFGMRGRLAILSEAYSNADLRTRVSASYNFVLEILRLAAEERATIRRLVGAGVPRLDSVTVRSRFAEPRQEDVIAEITEAAGDGAGGFSRRRRTGVFRTIRMPVFDRFAPLRKEALPAAYLLPPQHSHIAEALQRHGIRVGRLMASWEGDAEAFRVDSLVLSSNLFEGHREVRVEGLWQARPAGAAAGWFVVPTDQRLGLLAAYLLEPASEDGFATWNFLDRDLRRGRDAPVLRLRRMPALLLTELP